MAFHSKLCTASFSGSFIGYALLVSYNITLTEAILNAKKRTSCELYWTVGPIESLLLTVDRYSIFDAMDRNRTEHVS